MSLKKICLNFACCGLCVLGLCVLANGCSSPAAPPSDEKVKELNQKMDNDMKNMTLPSKPGNATK